MDILDCIKHMIADSGYSARQVSRMLDRSPNFLGSTFVNGSDVGASHTAKIANLLGWHLVLKKGDMEMEVTPRADSDKGTANQRRSDTEIKSAE